MGGSHGKTRTRNWLWVTRDRHTVGGKVLIHISELPPFFDDNGKIVPRDDYIEMTGSQSRLFGLPPFESGSVQKVVFSARVLKDD